MKRNRWMIGSCASALVLTVALTAGCSSPAASSADGPPGVNVNGVGEVQGAPDTLTTQIGVQATAEDVTAAIEQANSAVTEVTDAVLAAGVAREDIQTQQVSIDPQYSGALPGGNSEISGYQATNTLQVTVRDLSRASAVLGDATSAGGNATRISGVSFKIDDDSELISDARSRAFADARERAEQYASLAGGELGDVLSITESITGQEQPASFRDSASFDTAVPIEPGQQTVSVSVSVKWALN
ncbi:SIMPL domain-containing protein [Rhodococcus sp. Leaf278]|uniref:SIMPL domain-containing protein n=1 Tax=Rhodococcus sp. Leaf278 TaxID=1736319 RepID=UPI001F3918CC|nr:SIMPL domain-containing protein [Rhodococcus sp. Leaf278]